MLVQGTSRKHFLGEILVQACWCRATKQSPYIRFNLKIMVVCHDTSHAVLHWHDMGIMAVPLESKAGYTILIKIYTLLDFDDIQHAIRWRTDHRIYSTSCLMHDQNIDPSIDWPPFCTWHFKRTFLEEWFVKWSNSINVCSWGSIS